jgi:hypothetical protein
MDYDLDLEYFVDFLNKRIHLLGKEDRGHLYLANTMSPDFQKRFIEHHNLLEDVLDFEWLCYLKSRIVISYANYGYKWISANHPKLHKSFLQKMVERESPFGLH